MIRLSFLTKQDELTRCDELGLIKALVGTPPSVTCAQNDREILLADTCETLGTRDDAFSRVPRVHFTISVTRKFGLSSTLKATIALLIIVVVVTVVVVVVVVTVVVVVVIVVVVSRPYPTVPGQMANPIAVTAPRRTRT
ncbi:hypothetical protein Tco_0734205 [Tanacetum coccineum]